MLNSTHDSSRRSWVASANTPDADFPLQNLPHGVFSQGKGAPRGGMAIGDSIFDLGAAIELNLFSGETKEIAHAASEATLNRFMAMGQAASTLRGRVFELLESGSGAALTAHQSRLLIPMSAARMHVPVFTRSYSDFCTSIPHVTANRRARPGRPLHHALKHLPVGYGGRASSIVVSGTEIKRPYGQGMDESTNQIYFDATHRLDFELEFGAYLATGNELGSTIPMNAADDSIFGYVLLNDWSARDLQRFESLLGPFLGKSFASSVSPWVVTQEALLPFRCAPTARPAGDPQPLPYLTDAQHERSGALDVQLQALLLTDKMRAQGIAPQLITDTNLLHLYWTLPQMVAHHSSNGCNMETGDLLGSGTVSGPEEHQAACLWEITGGSLPIELPTGESRVWLEDGDELILRGRASKPGHISIGFGTCSGRVVAAG